VRTTEKIGSVKALVRHAERVIYEQLHCGMRNATLLFR
jgi:hypothetical protein